MNPTNAERPENAAMFLEYPDVLSVKQLCEALGISRATAYYILQDGQLHSLKVGRAYRIPKRSLIEYFQTV